MLNWEKELLGLYISSHPIDPLLAQLGGQMITSTLELKAEDAQNEKQVTFVGLVAALRKIPTKNHDMMGIATLEDRFGTIDTVLFPRTWNKYGEMIQDGAVVKIIGKLDLTRNDPQIICEEVSQEFTSVVSDQNDVARPSMSPPFALEPDEDWNTAPAGNGNGWHSNGQANAHGNQIYEPPPSRSEEPPSWDELPPLELDEAEWRSTRPEPLQPMEPTQKLRVRFIRNGDEGRDRRRLERLVGILTQQHGKDHFEIVLVTDGEETHLMVFPNHTTLYGEKLLKDLNDIKGIEIQLVAGVSQA
jgi:hypothetical protein